MNILIVGLGLIGGSIAKSLKGFRGCKIRALDTDAGVIKRAVGEGVICEGAAFSEEMVKEADLTVLCLYPSQNSKFFRDNIELFKTSAVVTDVSGIKGLIQREFAGLGRVEFVPAHPMAGREVGGYDNSDGLLFKNANYILTPFEDNSERAIALVTEMAEYMGAKVIIASPDEHDDMIAYTSQLMHVVAIALCQNPKLKRANGFSAGSLRDCTRVANINERLWSELFVGNKAALIEQIDEFERHLDLLKTALYNEDRAALEELMSLAKGNKLKFLNV